MANDLYPPPIEPVNNTAPWRQWFSRVFSALKDIPNGLILNERADHSQTPEAGKMEIWSKSDAPTTIYATDDAGTDHQIGPKSVLMTEQASTSGASIDFTNIPAWVKKITVMFAGVSTNGTSDILIQLGDSEGFEATGYLGAGTAVGGSVSTINYTAGFGSNNSSGAAAVIHGPVVISLEDSANNVWVCSGVLSQSNAAAVILMSGSKPLSSTLTQVRITTVNGTDTFDAGAINVMYE